jgi:hypothetical protein
LHDRRRNKAIGGLENKTGPITVRDVIYGHGVEIEQSGQDFYAHKTGFTQKSLMTILRTAGFPWGFTGAGNLEVMAVAFLSRPDDCARTLFKLYDGVWRSRLHEFPTIRRLNIALADQAATPLNCGTRAIRREDQRMFYRFEHFSRPLLPRAAFLRRFSLSALAGLILIGVSLVVGMLGYHGLERLSWLDSFLNASMILGGMGPIWSPQTDAGKIFAGLYALYSGLAVLAIIGIIFAPVIHRLLHRFHADTADQDDHPQ